MTTLLAGTVHNQVPADLGKALTSNKAAITAWNDITPLARNEWICWVENAKLIETRKRRIERTHVELVEGVRRPCCWIGCIHRTDKVISPSVQWVLDKKKPANKTH
jgi:hypothetical protein